MFQNSHFVLRSAYLRSEELRRRAAEDAVAEAVRAEHARARREAVLERLRAAAAAKQERAVFTWESQRQSVGFRRLRGAR